MFGLMGNQTSCELRQARRGRTGTTRSSGLRSFAERQPLAVSLGAIALLALAVGVAVSFYPELARTIHMHRM